MSEKLLILEDILFKSFIVGFILLCVSFVVYLVFNQQILNIWMALYNLDAKSVSIIMVSFYGFFKMIVFLFFLIPAVGVHWARKSLEKKEAS